MFWLTDKALLVCIHETGKVQISATQDLVFIDGMPVLIEPDPESRSISGCPLAPPLMKPCLLTLPVRSGYSDLVTIQYKDAPHRLCLDIIRGLTDGTPPGTYDYKVNYAGQVYVSEVQ
jgi:hypothetical protein